MSLTFRRLWCIIKYGWEIVLGRNPGTKPRRAVMSHTPPVQEKSMTLKITEAQAERFRAARSLSPSARKAAKKTLFAEIRRANPQISTSTRLKVEVDNRDPCVFGVLKAKANGFPISERGAPVPFCAEQAASSGSVRVFGAAPPKPAVQRASRADVVRALRTARVGVPAGGGAPELAADAFGVDTLTGDLFYVL